MTATGLSLKAGDAVPGTKYTVVRPLGAGGMGVVYQVVKQPNIAGVMKLMSLELAAHEEHRMRFFDEVRILAQLDHPNIVRVFDYDSLPDGTPFYVMELLNGRTVRDVIYTMGRVPPRVAYEVIRQLLEALQCAHTHEVPVIHRDIKPENIFLHAPRHGEPVVKLIDFGVSAISDRKHDGSFVGTWSYAAPEQIRGERPTPQTDLYAVALVLYEMLAGVGPFDHYDDWTKVSDAQLRETPALVSKFAPWVPASIVTLIAKSLAKDPRERPRDAYAFAEQLYELEWASDGKNPHDFTVEGPSAAQQTPPMPMPMPAPPPLGVRAPTPVMQQNEPLHVSGSGPLSQALHRLTGVPNMTSPTTNSLLNGLGAEPRKPPSKRERGSGRSDNTPNAPNVPNAPNAIAFAVSGQPTPAGPYGPTAPRELSPRPPTAVTLDAPDSANAPAGGAFGASAPGARDTFSSQSSDAKRPPRARTASVALAIGAALTFFLVAGVVLIVKSRTVGHDTGSSMTALTAPTDLPSVASSPANTTSPSEKPPTPLTTPPPTASAPTSATTASTVAAPPPIAPPTTKTAPRPPTSKPAPSRNDFIRDPE